MRFHYISFLRRLFFFTLLLAALGFAISLFLPDAYRTPALPYLYVFFFSVTLLVHYILLKVSLKKANSFINIFMLLTFGKLIFFLSVILVYALLNRDDAPRFIISFFILYLFFTVFEVLQSLKHASQNSVSSKASQGEKSTTG